MRGADDRMACLGYELRLGVGRIAPEEKHDWFGPLNQGSDHVIGEVFPSLAAMGVGGVRPDGENGVEHEQAASGPRFKVAMVRGLEPGQVGGELSVDVAQRARQAAVGRNREAESVGVAGSWVGILPKEDNADGVRWRELQSAEAIGRGG